MSVSSLPRKQKPQSIRGTYIGDGNDTFTREPIKLPRKCSMVYITGVPSSGNAQQAFAMRDAIDGIRHVINNASTESQIVRLAADGRSFIPSAVGTNGANESGTTYYYVAVVEE